jgi:hypothetical protein
VPDYISVDTQDTGRSTTHARRCSMGSKALTCASEVSARVLKSHAVTNLDSLFVQELFSERQRQRLGS